MLACICQPASGKHLYSSTGATDRKLNKPPFRVIRITNRIRSNGGDKDEARSPPKLPSRDCPSAAARRTAGAHAFRVNRCKSLSSPSESDSESEESSGSGGKPAPDRTPREPSPVTEEPRRSRDSVDDGKKLPDGVELSLWELQEMATRQQQQIESQHQILVAKEQRLRYLKHQEARTHQVAAENERLRRLKERVENQELKLRKLRALRGQVDQDKISNGTLTSDLDSIRALFNEKEKELSLAVAKVEELTRQLEELKRNGRTKEAQPPASAALELDKLRRELLFRNKLKEQQNTQLNQQRDALSQRQEEINSIDKRITELQDRLQRKRLLNQQLATQLQYNNNNNDKPQGGVRAAKSTSGLLVNYQGQRQNVAAVEPYLHVPNAYHQQTSSDLVKSSNADDSHKNHSYQKQMQKSGTKDGQKEQSDGVTHENNKNKGMFIDAKDDVSNIKEELAKMALKEKSKDTGSDFPTEFPASKSDPKYQTLPYNTKFSVNYGKNLPYQNGMEGHTDQGDAYLKNTGIVNPVVTEQQQPLMTAHSTPIPTLSLNSASRIPSHLNPRVYGHQASTVRVQPVGGTSPSSSASSGSSSSHTPKPPAKGFQQKAPQKAGKPVSSVAPTNVVQKSARNFAPTGEKPSPIYQTSSTKILPVQPQTLGSSPQGMLRDPKGDLSPPASSSTPIGTPEASDPRTRKPALPPKPAVPVKPSPPPPPRQAHPHDTPESKGYVEITAESLDQALSMCKTPRTDSKSDEVPFESDRSRTPTPPPPPPPTTEPPDDASPRRIDNIENISKDDKLDSKHKISQSSSLVNSGTQINNNNNNNNKINMNAVNGNVHHQHQTTGNSNVHVTINRRIEMPPAFMFPENEAPPADLMQTLHVDGDGKGVDDTDRALPNGKEFAKKTSDDPDKKAADADDANGNREAADLCSYPTRNGSESASQQIVRRVRKGNLKSTGNKGNGSRRVSFDPLALLLDASLEGELELVMKTASQVPNPSAANDEGITALHNAICAGHLEIVKFLVEFGCDVNAQDSDGWTPLHCAASCNNLAMVRFLVEHGACIFATTLSDHETAAEKCEEDEEGFDGCSEYLYSIQEKLGILNSGVVYAVYDYTAHNNDELSFAEGDRLVILRKGDEMEREWWWSRLQDKEGYTPRNLLGLYPRVHSGGGGKAD